LCSAIYQIQDLKQIYDRKTVLEIDRLSLSDASISGLIGPNGSGKSTLLRLLGFIEKPAEGKILFEGRTMEPFSPDIRFRVTLLSQEPYLMKRTVFNNVAYGLQLRGNTSNLSERVSEALSWVGLPASDFTNRPWFALSGGEAQRVALAARLILRPKVLLLDEPTTSVDAASAQLIKEASLNARRQWNTALVIASHDLEWLYEICDEVIHMFKGRLLGADSENLVFGPWQHLSGNYWGKCLPGGQRIFVPHPPDRESTAVIDTFQLVNGETSTAESGLCSLTGILTKFILERSSGDTIATVSIDTQTFMTRLNPQRIREQQLVPGCKITLRYNPDLVKWI
jgi:tungstate transport system ATP-binding protein